MPPEAFTNKELAQAMHWRESQPEYVKAMTTTPESLISLFKKAQRTSNGVGNGSKMSDSFRSDLKSLAKGLRNFESEPAPPEEPVRTTFEEAPAPSTAFSPAPPPPVAPTPPAPAPQSPSTTTGLDPLTRQMIQEVKLGLNLSDDTEVIRMLVKLGYERAKTLLPSGSSLG